MKITDAEQELKRVQRNGINNDTQKQREQKSMEEKINHLEETINTVELQYQVQCDTWNNLRSKIMHVHDELGLSV